MVRPFIEIEHAIARSNAPLRNVFRRERSAYGVSYGVNFADGHRPSATGRAEITREVSIYQHWRGVSRIRASLRKGVFGRDTQAF